MGAVRVRDDEHAEIELRILVALYDAWPNRLDVRPSEVYRPAGRYTTPNDVASVMRQLLAGRVEGQMGNIGLVERRTPQRGGPPRPPCVRDGGAPADGRHDLGS